MTISLPLTCVFAVPQFPCRFLALELRCAKSYTGYSVDPTLLLYMANGTAKPWLARVLARYPAVRVSCTWILSFLLRPSLLPLLYRVFGFRRPNKANPGEIEQDALDFVKQNTPQGDAQAVLDAIDHFVSSGRGFLMNIGDTKARLVEAVLAQHNPTVALELGSYVGYSAITTARKLPPGGKLYGIDPNPIHVRIAQEMIQHAGLSHKAEIIQGILETAIPELRKRGVSTVDYTLIDHDKAVYLKDLLILQSSGFLKKGSVIVADNLLLPGAPDYRTYVAKSPDFHTVEHIVDMSAMNYLCDIVSVSEVCGPARQ